MELHLASQIPAETEAASAKKVKDIKHKQSKAVRDLVYSQNTDSLTCKNNRISSWGNVHTAYTV